MRAACFIGVQVFEWVSLAASQLPDRGQRRRRIETLSCGESFSFHPKASGAAGLVQRIICVRLVRCAYVLAERGAPMCFVKR